MTEAEPSLEADALDRVISFPALVFYGLGVTVGAGIFALLGEILGLAGDNAPLSFLLAAILASFTGASYMLLVRVHPKAGGEAVYVKNGIGPKAALAAGLGVVATGILTGAVVALAFGGYLSSIVDLPEKLSAVFVALVLSLVAWWGVKESVIFAGIITVMEVGTLVVVAAFGLDLLDKPGLLRDAFVPSLESAAISPILAGSVVAFFAFVGFENMASMAEETIDPKRTAPRAIFVVLLVSSTIYVLLALVAVAVSDRSSIIASSAPMATLFEEVSGLDARLVATVASLAMINGILIQIVMSARVLYGMAKEGLLFDALAKVDPVHHTPTRTTALVTAAMVGMILFFPLVELARITSLVTLVVFTLVNASLFLIGSRQQGTAISRFRWVGLVGAALSLVLAVWQILNALG